MNLREAGLPYESTLTRFTTRHLNADDADSPPIDADLTGFVSLRAENPRKSVFFCVNLRPRKSVSGNELTRQNLTEQVQNKN